MTLRRVNKGLLLTDTYYKYFNVSMQDKASTNSTAEEIMMLRKLLAQGLFLLGLEYPERLGILMALKTTEQIMEMLLWIRQNLERKPSQEEIMDVFAVIAAPNSITF